ncbi:tRNA-uridine aminocarboxypropyltransferase [Rheinheimera mangrovi]|uniref:tRNA-uridine aminocarboxypropyltransferase n=1 Tax=Rheinheimera mangrovi TaxID=2498451 RepID=UPI001E3C7FE5|nr:tRNA-uridine aminocarboxypropyltransferase [Rheinheimera mangrovi]
MSHINSVMALRERELQKTVRVFNARGSRVIRCPLCLLPVPDCICAAKPQASSRSAFCFVMYKGEAYKPTNTGRLIADVAPENFAFVWDRTQPDPELLALLQNPKYAPIVVFPQQYASPARCIDQVNTGDKIPLFVMLDGTWREAKKMFSKSPYLDAFPVLGIQPKQSSLYQLREAAHDHQLCTAEVGIAVLELAGDMQASQDLADYFAVFRKNYIAGKPHITLLQMD